MRLRPIWAVTVIMLGALFAGVVVWLWQSNEQRVFESSSVLVVDAGPSTLAAAGGRPENIVFLARTYAARAAAQPVLEAAVTRSGLTLTPDEAAERISVGVSNQDATMTLRATGPSAAEARALNLALSDALIEQVEAEQVAMREDRLQPLRDQIVQLEARLPGLSPGSAPRLAVEQQYQALVASLAEAEIEPLDRVDVLSPPTEPEAPVAPRPLRSALLAFLVAGVVGIQVLVGWRLLGRSGGEPTSRWITDADG